MRSQYYRRTAAMGLVLVAATLVVEQPSGAQSSTESYSYDSLGRLIKVATAGGQNNGEGQSLCYDKAGNRTAFKASADGTVATCTPPPPPPPPPPITGSLSINDTNTTEGGTVIFTVTLAPAQTSTVTVNYATAYATAGSGDFTAVSGTLTFTAGQTSKTISVVTKNNQIAEPTEYFTLTLSSPTGPVSLADSQGIGTIFDDDDGGGCALC